MSTSVAALVPGLTSLDERVLAQLVPPAPARVIAERVHGWPGWTCDGCGYVHRRGRRKWEGMGVLSCGRRLGDDEWCTGRWQPGALLADDDAREVLEILHGLENIGRAHEVDGVYHAGRRS